MQTANWGKPQPPPPPSKKQKGCHTGRTIWNSIEANSQLPPSTIRSSSSNNNYYYVPKGFAYELPSCPQDDCGCNWGHVGHLAGTVCHSGDNEEKTINNDDSESGRSEEEVRDILCHAAKVKLLRHLRDDIYCNIQPSLIESYL